jgi:hypothetical protein
MTGRPAMDWAAMRRDAANHAKQGDYTLLFWLARKGRLDRRLQQLVADIFGTKRKRKRGRSPDLVKKDMQREAIRNEMLGRVGKKDNIVADVAKDLGIGKRTVYAALKQPEGYVALADLGAGYRRARPASR